MSTKDDRRGTTEAKGGGMFNRLFRRGTKDPPPLSTKDLTIVAGLPVPAPNPDPAKTRGSSGGVEKQSKSGKKASSSVHSMSSSSSKGSKGKKKKKHRDSSVSSRGSRSSKSSKGSRGKKRKTSDRIKRPPRESLASNKSKSSSKKSDNSDKTPSSTVVPSTSKSPTAVPTPPVPSSSSSSSKKTTSTTKVLKVKPDGKPEAPAPASSKKAPADASGSPAAYTSDKGRLRVSSSENPPAPPTNPGRAGDYGGSADDETDNARGLMTPAPPKISGKPAPTPAPAPPTNGGGGGGGNSSDESDNEPASDEDIEYGFVPFRDGPGVSLPMYDSGYHRPAGLPAPAVHPRDRALERQSSKTKLAGELEAAPAVQMNSLSATPKVKKSLFDDDDVFDESELAGILGDISRNERGGTASILAEDNDISEDFLERGRRTSVESVESIEDEPPSVHATRGMAFVDESFHVRRGSTSAGSDGATGALGEYEFADDGPPQIPAHLRR